MQLISWTVLLFVILCATGPSTEQGHKPWRLQGDTKDENKIDHDHKIGSRTGYSQEEFETISRNAGKDGIEYHGHRNPKPKQTTVRRPPVTQLPVFPPPVFPPPTFKPLACPIVECNPNTILNLTGTGLKRIGDAFVDSSSTRELYLDDNGITEFSAMAIVSLNSLEVLSLCENNLSVGNLLWFKEHRSLRKLVINGNKRVEEDMSIRKTFQSLPNLRDLSLRRNRIYRFEISLKKFAPVLHRFDLSGNEIESTDFLDELPGTLRQLYLDDNAIFKMKENVLNGLTILSLSGNKFQKLCRDDCVSSNWLNLRDMRRLSTLNVSRNDLDTVSDDAFRDTVDLATLDLSGNRLKSLPKDVFLGLNKLKELRLRDNKLVAVPNVCHLNNMKLLDLSGNVIEAVADLNFCSPMYVETVLLANNRILHVVDNAFLSLQTLKTLDLSKNLIDKLPMALITESKRLEVLSLKDNEITSIDDMYTPNAMRMVGGNTLRKLHLEGNPFVSQKIGYMPNLTIMLKEPPSQVAVTVTDAKGNATDSDEST